jgi:hypothetical protein
MGLPDAGLPGNRAAAVRTGDVGSAGSAPAPKALIESVRKTYAKSVEIIERKNHDYSGADDAFANFRTAGILGISAEKGILLRTLDKIARINNLLDHAAYVTDESMDDTITDAIGYLAILKAYRETNRE